MKVINVYKILSISFNLFFPQKIVPAERGSGQISLKDLHKLDEMVREAGMEGRIKFMKDLMDDPDKNKKD